MARESGGDPYDLSNLSDDEIRQLVLDHLRDYANVDAGWVDVDVRDGRVILSGRVGTDGEVRVVEDVVHDVLGIENYSIELVVDELHRGEMPVAADDAAAVGAEVVDPSGEPDPQQSDTAEHLVSDLESDTYGTHDVGEAIRDGNTYIPPYRPVPRGYGSRENH